MASDKKTGKETGRPDDAVDPETAAKKARAQRIARRLGPIIPESTGDDTDVGWSEREHDSRDSDIARDVPPHY